MVQSADIKQKALEIGFDLVGIAIANLESYPEADRLKSWLAMGYHADMAWMENPKRLNIKELMPSVQSVICVGLNYYTSNNGSNNQSINKSDTQSNIRSEDAAIAKISRYGWGRDYHRILGKKLKSLSQWLESQGSDIETRFYVDTAPIAEKAWAQRAGIGWIGKHSNLISRGFGSWIFLGEILTNLELEPDLPHTEHCGTCTRCLDACPTGAIAQPFVVDANRCIAYHTIENKSESLPEGLALENWVAGCDICQDVCPWNHRFAQETKVQEFQPYPQNTAPNLAELAKITDLEWDKHFTGSALRRIKPDRLRRNAQAAMTAFMAKLE